MFDIPMAPTALHLFIETNHQSLQNAALLLGGRPWLRRVQGLIDQLQLGAPLSKKLRNDVFALYELLTLEHVHDDDRPECGYFAELDPTAPYVEDICLLADELMDALVLAAADASSFQSNTSYGGMSEHG
ncbi:hypothetical protein [Limimaricola cinnabarinus]|uniref:hypothetical protein n=1 Tax=Limimaricola cinnabarinus TaxID=1125964 RepID=UPI001C1F6EDE|nr:hypothetical protein [Limimaricola cinnabarinus]